MPETVAEIAAATGISRTTIQHQLARGSVQEGAVVSLARACKIDPILALGNFTPYQDLPAGVQPPSRAEVLSQVSAADILAEVLTRESEHSAAAHYGRELAAFPHEESVRMWLDAIDPGGLRKHVSKATGISAGNLSTQITQNRLAAASAVHAARYAKVSLASGLVITGLLRPAEAFWHPRTREETLRTLPEIELLRLAEARISNLRRRADRPAQTNRMATGSKDCRVLPRPAHPSNIETDRP